MPSGSVVRPGVGKMKLAEQIAARIEGEVKALGWPVGHNLGSEPELIERYEVSRSVFREAIRLVEHHNVCKMRKGPGGGLVIVEPDASAVTAAVQRYLEFNNVEAPALFDTRRALELTAVELATDRLDETAAQRLREVLEEERETLDTGDVQRDDVRPYDVHMVIAELTGDATLHLFVEVVCRLMPMHLRPPASYAPAADAVHRAHHNIVEAMVSGDAALARHRMHRHLTAVESFVRNDRGSGG
jgi:DNA-binding FadR family transcriptional regulator